jgi:hypothetical protein
VRHYHPSSGAQNNCNYSIMEQGTGEQNPLFQVAIDTMLTSATTWKQKQINTPPETHSNQFQLFHDSSRQHYGTYIIHYSTELIAFSAQYTLLNNCNFHLVYRYTLSANLTLSITVYLLPDAVVTVVLCSWWWVIVTPETCRAVVRQNKFCDLWI